VTAGPGLFLVLDGPDGAGKSTQVARLAARLAAAGRDVLLVREPGGTAAGERIRTVLLDPAVGDLDPVTELFLYQASRRRLVLERIAPALAEGRTVVCDRWHTATTVYQGIAGGVDRALVEATTRAATDGLEPRRAVLLDVPEAVARERLTRPLDRMERKDAEFRARVRDGFRAVFAGDPDRRRVVDASRDADAVERDVWEAVRDVL
jgi:dTMP kinase